MSNSRTHMVTTGISRLRSLGQKPTLTKDNRTSFYSSEWKGIRVKFICQTAAGGIAFMIWFIATCSYLYGTLYGSSHRHHNFRVLAVDYDGGVIGQSLNEAYKQLMSPEFFNLEFHTPEEFPTEEDMYHAVWEGKFWGAISATNGASNRLVAAIQGNERESYKPSESLHFVWNEVKYPAFSSSVVYSGMQTLVGATRVAYTKINGTQASQMLDQRDPAAIQALLNPIAATSRNVKSAQFGATFLLNTVGTVTPVLSQFFFCLVLNGVMREHRLFSKITVRSSLLVRRIAGLVYGLGAALAQTGYIWAFREDWDVNGVQFVLTLMTFWLLMNVHLLILDTISTLAPMPVMPFTVLAWIFMNIASTISPLEIQPGFYRLGLALPGYNAYSIMVTIWTGGADNRLYRALPILFAWWVAGSITTTVAHWRACHLAFKLEREHVPEAVPEAVLDKDEEADLASVDVAMSRQTTVRRTETGLGLRRMKTVEETALEQRQVYGPSICWN